MKVSAPPAGPLTLDRQKAWACLTSNLALPGFGSLLARRKVGYVQVPLCVLGLVLTLAFGSRFVVWYFTHRAQINDPQGDPFAVWSDLWRNARWALLGIGVFGFDLLWALGTSLLVVSQARRQEAARRDSPPTNPSLAGQPRTSGRAGPEANNVPPRRPPRL